MLSPNVTCKVFSVSASFTSFPGLFHEKKMCFVTWIPRFDSEKRRPIMMLMSSDI